MNQYYYRNTTVFGFHGCHKDVKHDLLTGNKKFNISAKSYDWLGSGVYFWENDEIRALQWSQSRFGNAGAVIGAKINLLNCFDVSNSYARNLLIDTYTHFKKASEASGIRLPTNQPHPKLIGNPADNALRYLDRAVVELTLHNANSGANPRNYSIVRAAFQEGFELYSGSAFREHDHIHLCVRNPDLLTELFDPEEYK
jgi:hypothetical protein